MGTKILITGGSGMIGQALSAALSQKGHQVSHLSRNPLKHTRYPSFKWDIARGYIDPSALKVDVIIHLSGEGIANKRWTEKQKQKLIVSRIDAAQLLYDQVIKLKTRPIRIISASAIGYYGSDTQDEECFENTPAGDDFIGKFVCKWEQQVNQFETLGIRVTLLRIGIVLSKVGGALPKLTLPILWGVGAPIGSGRQNISWIHLDDLVKMFVFVVERQVLGIYNAVTQNTTNTLLTQAIAKQLKRPLFLPNIPGFFLKIIFGEMSKIILGGNQVSGMKIIEHGFKPDYPTLEGALSDIFKKNKDEGIIRAYVHLNKGKKFRELKSK